MIHFHFDHSNLPLSTSSSSKLDPSQSPSSKAPPAVPPCSTGKGVSCPPVPSLFLTSRKKQQGFIEKYGSYSGTAPHIPTPLCNPTFLETRDLQLLGDISDTNLELDLSSDLRSTLRDTNVHIPLPSCQEEEDQYLSSVANTLKKMMSLSNTIPFNEPKVRSSSTHVPSKEDIKQWYCYYFPDAPEHSWNSECSKAMEVNGSCEFRINKPSTFSGRYGELQKWLSQIYAYLAINSHIHTTNHIKIGLTLLYMTEGVIGAFTANYITNFVNSGERQYCNTWKQLVAILHKTFSTGDVHAQAVIMLKFLE
ncbi:hypothetical protein EDD16DRAFT_1702987 [Pisolithus croceorrhizus]|nr:hypothetical protein EV401DRAFT_2076412 [Pisolithus croceorrhizus]KAI6125878.1 hypothetical protein EDD16DRAFT_1702987 [Pisolithus croceorrhizus]KAI6137518.1 hypothetical protein EDD17DRAFT_1771478 [Pisolithus thermaeus]